MVLQTFWGVNSLTEPLLSQDEPAYCGLATLAMVLNSLSIGEPITSACKTLAFYEWALGDTLCYLDMHPEFGDGQWDVALKAAAYRIGSF